MPARALDHPGRAAPLVRHLHRAQSALARQPAQGAAGVPRRGRHGCRVASVTSFRNFPPPQKPAQSQNSSNDSEVPSTLYPQTGESPRELAAPLPAPGQSTSPARPLPPSLTLLTAVRRAPKPPHRIQHGQGKRCARPCRCPRARAILIKGSSRIALTLCFASPRQVRASRCSRSPTTSARRSEPPPWPAAAPITALAQAPAWHLRTFAEPHPVLTPSVL